MSSPPLALLGLAAVGPGLALPPPPTDGLELVVDRIEGAFIVAELPDGDTVDLPLALLPGCREGARLRLCSGGLCSPPPVPLPSPRTGRGSPPTPLAPTAPPQR